MIRRTFARIRVPVVALVVGGLLLLTAGALQPDNSYSSTTRRAAEPFGAARGFALPTASPKTAIYLDEGVPALVSAALQTWAQSQPVEWVSSSADAALRITTRASTGGVLLAERVYVPVAWFPTLNNALTMANLGEAWKGKSTTPVYVSDETASVLAGVLGTPAANVKRAPAGEITSRLWSDPRALGIVPFDELNVKLTALQLDGVNVLSRDAAMDAYPLLVRVWLDGDPLLAQGLAGSVRALFPATNRDSGRMTTLVMTGVTALTRQSASQIEQKHDPGYPARKLAPVLSRADIVHVSNEVSFVDDCVAEPSGTLRFCSKPSYLETLKLIGTKIVGLTGNHVLDFGARAFLNTLDIYERAGMRYYGGGRDAVNAAKPLYLSDHGNRVAFLGANSFGPPQDWATASQPGALAYNGDALAAQVSAARKQAELVFVELQADETYEYTPDANNIRMFRRTLADGADVVTGVQAHQPQALEFSLERTDKLILYGLGNLFFDQMFSEAVRQGVIARHTIYQGRLLQTELLTIMLEDYVQPRWTTPAEREKLLRAIFGASGFKLP